MKGMETFVRVSPNRRQTVAGSMAEMDLARQRHAPVLHRDKRTATEPEESAATPAVSPDARRCAINFGRLRTMMLARCLDQRSLAALAGLSEATVSHLMSGRNCAPKSLKKLCLALAKTPVDDLAQELTRDGSE